jgi:hypothetical protein
VGSGAGSGTNLNIVWGRGGMSNLEYAAAFSEAVLPALSSYQPDLLLIACGLDAAQGDLLGDCGLSPDMYYTMTRSLLDVAGPSIPIVAVLEGGYNLDVSAACMEQVALALLDEKSGATRIVTNLLPQLNIHHRVEKNLTVESYWDPASWDGGALSKIAKKTAQAAVASIKRSIRAISKTGIRLGDRDSFDGISNISRPKSRQEGNDDDYSHGVESIGENDICVIERGYDGHDQSESSLEVDEEVDHHRPIKKRRIIDV